MILAGTSIPGPELPHVPGRTDLAVHFGMYGVLGFLLARSARPARAGALILVVVVASAFGAMDELHQRLIPGRTASVDDWTADTMGAAIGAAALAAAARKRREPLT